MKKRLNITVVGRVQMVMFRDFTRREARLLRIVGWVKNMPDGTVLIVAEGTESDLQVFLEKVQRGPLLSRVDDSKAIWGEPTGEWSDFSIRY